MTPARIRRSRSDGDLSIDELSHAISTYGFAASERALEQFARRLMARGEVPQLTAIMLDRDAAPIVRERAFARAAVQLRHGRFPYFNVA